MGKVLLIGGSPMVGKSSVARKIAARHELSCMSTDDIGEILQTQVNINPMKGQDYLYYYENSDVDTLIEDLLQYHQNMQNAIERIVRIHSEWSSSIILEGYAIYPSNIQNKNANIDAIWILANEDLLEKRLNNAPAFQNASLKAKENYLKRSIWHNQFLEKECAKYNCKSIRVNGVETVNDLMVKILEWMDLF